MRRHFSPRATGLLAGGTLAALGAALPSAPALAQSSSLVGSWTGFWDGISTAFVEYRILKATPKALTIDYGWHSVIGGPVTYTRVTCPAVAANQFRCGASELTVNSPSSIEAVMHAQSGRTSTATLSR